MAVQGPIPVEFAHVFPRGAFTAEGFEPVRDFDASKAGRFVQAKDKASGLPVWMIDVIDADPQAREKTARVKVAAADQPVLPAGTAGMPFVPVEFTGLTARQHEIADSLSKLAREELKRGSKRTAAGKQSGTQRARNRMQAS